MSGDVHGPALAATRTRELARKPAVRLSPAEAIALLRKERAQLEAERLREKAREQRAQAIVTFHETEQRNLQERIDQIEEILFERYNVAPGDGA